MSEDTLQVSHYGIHWSPTGVAYLEQGRSGYNALGLRERSPFQVRLPGGKVHCNHQVPTAYPVPNDTHWDYLKAIAHDPLVKALLPIPKTERRAIFISVPEPCKLLEYIIALSTMSSPIYPIVQHGWHTLNTPAGAKKVCNDMMSTNIQPLIITNVDYSHTQQVQDVANYSLSAPRSMVFIGRPDVVLNKNLIRLDTEVGKLNSEEFQAIPWEGLGATVIRKYMRNELQL